MEENMSKSNLIRAAVVFGTATLLSGVAAANAPADLKMTKDQCSTLWMKALGSTSGDLAMDKAAPYVADFKKADTNSDKMLSSSEWMAACDQGNIRTADAGVTDQGTAATSDRTPAGATDKSPGATSTGAAGTEVGKTPAGTSDRTPSK
jgi:hypothetical protein